ncbi:hypothetical protein CMUS01_05302 [Colletotrichum musicola]|uniref:Uncharacterized protein n=1 Tax=Colletotrichum musicola TaxID=2175873 RepID=A0A8H6KSA8_9PEZI|nr:hypothetical protein CMUS01_05302 [Colletotrichum musicola]
MEAQKPLYAIPDQAPIPNPPGAPHNPSPLPLFPALLWEALPPRGVFYLWLFMQFCLVAAMAFIEISVAIQKVLLVRHFYKQEGATLADALIRMDEVFAKLPSARRRTRIKWIGAFFSWEFVDDVGEEGEKKTTDVASPASS